MMLMISLNNSFKGLRDIKLTSFWNPCVWRGGRVRYERVDMFSGLASVLSRSSAAFFHCSSFLGGWLSRRIVGLGCWWLPGRNLKWVQSFITRLIMLNFVKCDVYILFSGILHSVAVIIQHPQRFIIGSNLIPLS